jgi:hypothetical protein
MNSADNNGLAGDNEKGWIVDRLLRATKIRQARAPRAAASTCRQTWLCTHFDTLAYPNDAHCCMTGPGMESKDTVREAQLSVS